MGFCQENFRNPGVSAQPVYSWVWDAPVDEVGIRSRMRDMYSHGIRALYILPMPKEFRPSTMATSMCPGYMSDEFMHLMRVASDEAGEMGMRLWLYDEGGWPSGSVCTQISQHRPDLTRKEIVSNSFSLRAGTRYYPPVQHTGFLAAFVQTSDGDFIRITESFVINAQFEVTEFYVKAQSDPNGEPIYNTDIAHPDTGNLFIQMTHERYRSTLGDYFGRLIPIVFDDEPGLNPNPWTSGLDRLFLERYGYELLDYLPWIVRLIGWSTDAQRQAIIDYRLLICQLILHSFFLPIRNWCEENGLLSAGHLGGEHRIDLLVYEVHTYGNPMEILRSFHIPGVDAIWGQIRPGNDSDDPCLPFFPRLASSAARQTGRNLALTESMAVYGDGVIPDLIRYVVGFQAVRGINVFNLMNINYGDTGVYGLVLRPVYKPCKPGFSHLRAVNEYLARLSYLGQLGPTDTRAALYLPVNDLLVGESANSFNIMGNELESMHIDFDVVDDAILRRAVADKGFLNVGIASYSRIYVPANARVPDDVRRKITPFMTQKVDPVIVCTVPLLRAQKRVLKDGSVICMVFNENNNAIEDCIDLLDSRPIYRLNLVSGSMHAELDTPTRVFLQPGEMAVFLITEQSLLSDPTPERIAWEIPLLSFEAARVKRFEINAERIQSVSVEEEPQATELGVNWAERYGRDFSGEVVYRLELTLPEEPRRGDFYELDLGTVEYTADVSINGHHVGILAFSPFVLLLTYEQLTLHSKIEIKVANTAANQCVSADFRAFWPEREIGPYHEKQLVFEREMMGGGLAGPVYLRKLNG